MPTEEEEVVLEEYSKSTVKNVDLSCSNFWAKALNDITVIVNMTVPVNQKYKLTAMMCHGEEEVATFSEFKNPFNSKEDVSNFTNSTALKFIIPEKFLQVGENILKLKVQDENPKEGTTGISIVEHKINVETRNDFSINRNVVYKSEYLISGAGTINNENGFHVTTNNGNLQSICVPKKCIEMDGRATVRTINVEATKDYEGECRKIIAVNNLLDMGEYSVQNIPFSEVMRFESIKSIQAVDV